MLYLYMMIQWWRTLLPPVRIITPDNPLPLFLGDLYSAKQMQMLTNMTFIISVHNFNNTH